MSTPAELAQKIEGKLDEVMTRVAAQSKELTDEQKEEARRIARVEMDAWLDENDATGSRKMRFPAGGGDDDLIAPKFARWGLSIADVEWLYEVQTSLTGQRQVSGPGVYRGPSEPLQKTFDAASQALYLSEDEVKEIDKRAIDNQFPRIPKSRLSRHLPAWVPGAYGRVDPNGRPADAAYQRAMDTAESGYGSQLIDAQYVRELWEVARAESRVMGLIPEFEMTDPVAYLPVEVDFPELLYVGENTANNSSNYTTVKTGSQRVQVSAKKFVIHQMWSGELEEDSIIPFVPFLRRQAALSIAHYSDSLVLNGDDTNAATGNINLDDADPADTKHYLAWDGTRHAALVDNTGNAFDVAGAITLAHLRTMKNSMIDQTRLVDWGNPTDPMDLVYVADPQTAGAIAMLDEVLSWKIRQTNADLLGGEVTRVLGHPVVSSIAMPLTEADGKVSTTGSNNTKGQINAFNRRGFIWGWRRRVRTEVERLPATDQSRVVYSLRAGFGRFTPTGAASGIEASSVAYDISL